MKYKYRVGQQLMFHNGADVWKGKIESIRQSGSKLTYWVALKDGSRVPINTLDNRTFYNNGEIRVISTLSFWTIL